MPINFTVTDDMFASADDSDDSGVDADVVALIGTVLFTPQFYDDRPLLALSASPRPAGFKVRSFTGFIDADGQLKNRRNGTVGVRLWANDPLFNLEELWYKVDYDLATPIGETVPVQGGFIKAPTTDTTVSLPSVLQQTGSGSPGVTKGDTGAAGSGRYEYVQSSAAATWTIANPLGATVYPASVTVIVGGQVVDADIDLSNLANIVITFATPQSGRALIS